MTLLVIGLFILCVCVCVFFACFLLVLVVWFSLVFVWFDFCGGFFCFFHIAIYLANQLIGDVQR